MEAKDISETSRIAGCLDGIFEAWRSCDSAYLQLVRQWGLSLNAVWALEYLMKHPAGVEPAVLADDTHMLRQTITVVLNDLEGRGYLSRAFHQTDRRRKIIRLTPTGEVFAMQVLSAISAAEQEAASSLTREEQQRLLDYSRRFSQEFARKVNDITLRKPE
ncbi:MAG: winged helix-turn-helix transcriptional regulator [Victivallales bacterium]|nr:winged helix-turn-helix transcriptional regulator [Victivallales bacterium]